MKFTDLPTSIREFSVIETPPSGAQKEKGGNKPKSKIKAEISKIKSRKTVGKKINETRVLGRSMKLTSPRTQKEMEKIQMDNTRNEARGPRHAFQTPAVGGPL